jgi:hypothetical protein
MLGGDLERLAPELAPAYMLVSVQGCPVSSSYRSEFDEP